MLTTLILATFISSAEAHKINYRAPADSQRVYNHKHSTRCPHAPRNHVWVRGYGWIPNHLVVWVPGHFKGHGSYKRWIPGRFVIK